MSIKSYFKKLFKKKPSELPGVFTLPIGSSISYTALSSNYSLAFKQVLEEERIILNSFDNNVKVLYQDLKPYIQDNYSFGFMVGTLEKDIKVCEILDKHLRNNKFNNKLEDIINE